ncbi:pentapeptide repeat-containing protein, partial [Micromonospora andamanensis]
DARFDRATFSRDPRFSEATFSRTASFDGAAVGGTRYDGPGSVAE